MDVDLYLRTQLGFLKALSFLPVSKFLPRMAPSSPVAATSIRRMTPAGCLPFELLEQIFAFGHRSLCPSEISRFVVTVSHVSKFWRHVSLHQKSLWTTLDLAWSMQHWKMWAERAGGKLLHCVLSSHINSRPKIQSRLEHHSTRICSMK